MQSIFLNPHAPFKEKIKRDLLYPLPKRLRDRGYTEYKIDIDPENSRFTNDIYAGCIYCTIRYYVCPADLSSSYERKHFSTELKYGTIYFKDFDKRFIKHIKGESTNEEPCIEVPIPRRRITPSIYEYTSNPCAEFSDRVEINTALNFNADYSNSTQRWTSLDLSGFRLGTRLSEYASSELEASRQQHQEGESIRFVWNDGQTTIE